MTKIPWAALAAAAIIIVVLAAIFFPVFAQSKESAKSASRLSELRQLEIQRAMEEAERYVPPLTQMSTAAMAQERQVIRKGSISVRVESVEDAERQITESVIAGGGYVESTTTSDLAGDDPIVDMTIRVKSSGFEDSLARLAELGTVLSKQVEATDVTAEIVDLGARVKTLTAKEDTFREMLRGARNTPDIIDLQNRLTEVRTEIERMEAQRKSLSQLASLSTIRVHLTQNATMPVVAQDPNWFGQTLASTATTFVGGMRSIVGAFLWIVGLAPFWALPALLGFWAWKRHGRTATTATS
ncbi:MAG: DUF4349 domain-containing protein [Armatimonadetes bacterium]|nr:DUF4349 domain-containing protein [Armatimonadota bacterium]